MNLYTRTGDEGMTSLKGGRVFKDHIRVETYGQVDELNAFVGVAISACQGDVYKELAEQLIEIQHELFDCGSDLAFAEHKQGKAEFKVEQAMVDRLEQWIDEHETHNPQLQRFILPGGCPVAAHLHVCRTVCRRVERQIVTLAHEEQIHSTVRLYVNRLSDYFFAASRRANLLAGVQDVEYIRSAHVFRRSNKEQQK